MAADPTGTEQLRREPASLPPPSDQPLPPWPLDVVAVLCTLGVVLLCFQYVTLDKLAPLTPPGRYSCLAELLATARGMGVVFDALDAGLLGVTAVLCVSLIALQIFGTRLSLLLTAVLASDRRALWSLALGGFVLARCYFARGQLCWTGDAPAHIAYAHFVCQSLGQGELPVWSNFIGAGTPYMLFYGFLFFYLVGVVDAISGDFWLAMKLVLGCSHLLSGLSMYCLARLVWRSRTAGLVAGLAYVATFWHLQQVLIMGRLPLSVFYALLPWPFYAVERLGAQRSWLPSVYLGSVSLALLAFTHPGYAFWATALLALYTGLRAWQLRHGPSMRSILCGGAGILLGGYLTLGMWCERHATGLHAGLSLAQIPDPDWRQLVLWSNYHFPLFPNQPSTDQWYAGYVGITVLALAAAGIPGGIRSGLRRDRAPCLPVALGLAVALVLTFGYRWSFLQSLPPVQALNASRYLLFATFYLCLLAGSGAEVLASQWPGPGRHVLTWIVIAIVVDLGSTSFQHLHSEPDRLDSLLSGPALDYIRDEGQAAPPDQIPGYRLFTSTSAVHPPMALAAAHLRGIPTFQSYHPGAIRSASDFQRPLESYLNRVLARLDDPRELATHPEGQQIRDGLALLNVRYLLMNRERQYFLHRGGYDHTPVLASVSVSPLPAEAPPMEHAADRMHWIIRETGVDLPNRTCEQIWLAAQGDAEGTEFPMQVVGTAQVEVLAHRVWPQRVELRVQTASPCFIRLAYSYYPSLSVSVDGELVEPWETADRFIALPVSPGVHDIALQASLSPLRRGLAILSLCALAAIGGFRVAQLI